MSRNLLGVGQPQVVMLHEVEHAPALSEFNRCRGIEDDVIKSVEELFVDERDRTRKAVQSPDGQLYILTDESNGRIIRIKNGED